MHVILESRENMEYWAEIQPVLQEYAKILRVEISVSNPHGKESPSRDDPGWLYVRFWSAPRRTERTHIKEAFGIRLKGGQHDAVRPSGEGILIEDETGAPVAEVVGGTLYVLFDLPHASGGGPLMRAIMEKVLPLFKEPEERERLLAEMAERELERSREAYVQECGRRMANAVKATRDGIAEAEASIESAMRTIVGATRKRDGLRRKLSQLLNSQEEYEERFRTEFEKLRAVPGVERIRVREGVVEVFTDLITVPFGGAEYEIGRFCIEIRTSGEVRCHNLTRKVDGYCHPHVKENGTCCLGNLSAGIAKLLGEYEYSVIAQVMIEYLKTCNPSDWYKSIENWPVVKPAGKEMKK
jgi:hypothetical protein